MLSSNGKELYCAAVSCQKTFCLGFQTHALIHLLIVSFIAYGGLLSGDFKNSFLGLKARSI